MNVKEIWRCQCCLEFWDYLLTKSNRREMNSTRRIAFRCLGSMVVILYISKERGVWKRDCAEGVPSIHRYITSDQRSQIYSVSQDQNRMKTQVSMVWKHRHKVTSCDARRGLPAADEPSSETSIFWSRRREGPDSSLCLIVANPQ